MENQDHNSFKIPIMLIFLIIITVGTSIIYLTIIIVDEIDIFRIPINYSYILIIPTVLLVLYVFAIYVKVAAKKGKWSKGKLIGNSFYIFFIIGLIFSISMLKDAFFLLGLGVITAPGLALLQINSIAGFWVLNNTERITNWYSSESKRSGIKTKVIGTVFSILMLLNSITPILIDRLFIRGNYYSSIQYTSDSSESESVLIHSLESSNISAVFGTRLNRYPQLDKLEDLVDFFVGTSKADKLVLFGLHYYEIFEYVLDIKSFQTGLKLQYVNLTETDEEYHKSLDLVRNATDIYFLDQNNETLFNWTQAHNNIYDYSIFVNLTYDPTLENQSEIIFDFPVKLVHIFFSYDHLFGNVGGLFIVKNIWVVMDLDNNIVCGVFQDRGTIAA